MSVGLFLILERISVLQRRHANVTLEDTDEIRAIRKAAFVTGVGNRAPLLEKSLGQRDSARLQIGDQGNANVLSENGGQIGGRDVDGLGNLMHGHILCQMRVDIGHGVAQGYGQMRCAELVSARLHRGGFLVERAQKLKQHSVDLGVQQLVRIVRIIAADAHDVHHHAVHSLPHVGGQGQLGRATCGTPQQRMERIGDVVDEHVGREYHVKARVAAGLFEKQHVRFIGADDHDVTAPKLIVGVVDNVVRIALNIKIQLVILMNVKPVHGGIVKRRFVGKRDGIAVFENTQATFKRNIFHLILPPVTGFKHDRDAKSSILVKKMS